MALLLNVPFVQKDDAKAKGARWNGSLKKWYAPKSEVYPSCYRWIGTDFSSTFILMNELWVLMSKRRCSHCARLSRTFILAAPYVMHLNWGKVQPWPHPLVTFSSTSFLPPQIISYIKGLSVPLARSESISSTTFATCEHCGRFLGTYTYAGSPFVLEQALDAEDILVQPIKLKYDIATDFWQYHSVPEYKWIVERSPRSQETIVLT